MMSTNQTMMLRREKKVNKRLKWERKTRMLVRERMRVWVCVLDVFISTHGFNVFFFSLRNVIALSKQHKNLICAHIQVICFEIYEFLCCHENFDKIYWMRKCVHHNSRMVLYFISILYIGTAKFWYPMVFIKLFLMEKKHLIP